MAQIFDELTTLFSEIRFSKEECEYSDYFKCQNRQIKFFPSNFPSTLQQFSLFLPRLDHK